MVLSNATTLYFAYSGDLRNSSLSHIWQKCKFQLPFDAKITEMVIDTSKNNEKLIFIANNAHCEIPIWDVIGVDVYYRFFPSSSNYT